MIQKKQHSLLNKADDACNVLKEHLDSENIIRIVSHNDSDGLSSAGIIANTISQENGQFHVSIVPRLKTDFIKKLSKEKYKLIIFSDMGSAYLDSISNIKSDVIISDHHQPMDHEIKNNITHINPHLFGIDGSKEISASGVTYLITRGLKKPELSCLALVGAFGDMQYFDNGFISLNKFILDEGIKSNAITVHQDLKLASKYEEPLYKSIAYTFNPIISELSGNPTKSKAFLEKIGIFSTIKFRDLNDEDKDTLKTELMKLNPKIFADIYTTPKESPTLRDIEEYSRILDACGKNKKYGLGLGICLGEKNDAIEVALKLQREYREDLITGLNWIKREGTQVMDNIQYLYSNKQPYKSVMGTIISIALSIGSAVPNLPILGFSRMDNMVKISGRTIPSMVEKGVNLGKALDDASANFNGSGGGHDIAAGAMIQYEDMDNFLRLVNDIVEDQIS